MGHELAATRRLRKGVLPSVGGAEARPTTDGATPAATAADGRAPAAPIVGERVVADVRHEVGNLFHKLYYWADYLAESRAGRPSDVTATQMLEESIRGLEELLHATLEYIRPLDASPVRMPARDVVDGIRRQVTSALGERAVVTVATDGVAADRGVVVDPGRVSQLLGALVRRIAAATEPDAALDVRIASGRCGAADVLALEVTGVAREVAHSTIAEVEWATAENVARLAGGDLTVAQGDGCITFGFTLPVR